MLLKKEEDKKKRKERARQAEMERFAELDKLRGQNPEEEIVSFDFKVGQS